MLYISTKEHFLTKLVILFEFLHPRQFVNRGVDEFLMSLQAAVSVHLRGQIGKGRKNLWMDAAEYADTGVVK